MYPSKTTDLSRRRLLRGAVTGRCSPIRPPWAVDEAKFTGRCDRCADCVDACEERVIRCGSGGFPEVDFSERGCTLCGACASACDGKALSGDPEQDRPWYLIAEIANACLANRGVVCRSCGEVCDERAIRFESRIGGAALPRLDADLCTGCGCCVAVCPAKAIDVKSLPAVPADGLAARPEAVSSSLHQEIRTR